MTSETAKRLYHDATMVQSQLTDNENRSREVLAQARERAPVKPSSMIAYATPQLIDSGSTGAQTCDRGSVVSRWAA